MNKARTFAKIRLIKKKAKKIIKQINGECYYTLDKFHVKNNKVDKVYLLW